MGNWAERNNISYSSYQELAANTEVGKILKEHVEAENMDLAKDTSMSGCQIKRFLVLHKELDPDDGEITRTRKVKRSFVEEKYADLVSALYSDKDSIATKTEVTYEDGRKGYLEATVRIVDATLYQLQKQNENAA